MKWCKQFATLMAAPVQVTFAHQNMQVADKSAAESGTDPPMSNLKAVPSASKVR